MAFLDEQELIDQIRHELRIEDDTGTCSRILAPERRRSKYGGLPLNFRQTTSSDDEDDRGDVYCDYEIPLFETPIHTKQVIDARLRSRTVESGDDVGPQTTSENQKEPSDLFIPREAVNHGKENLPCRSAVSRFLKENGSLMDNPLLEYAKFEAIGKQASKTILVLYNTNDEDISRIKISVQPSAKVGEVIGYCLYRIFADSGKILSGNVDDYQLLMADDGGEVETDLPPLDRSRSIGDLGFPVLALVSKRKSIVGSAKPAHRVVVYLPNGHQYIYELEHLDNTLEWLRDETLKRRKSEAADKRLPGLITDMEYVLEDVNVFNKPLNLSQSIGNSGCVEFVLVRKFSSRGEFHPRGTLFRQKSTALLTPISRTPNNLSSFDLSSGQMSSGEATSRSFDWPSQMLHSEEDGAFVSFHVNRVHRVRRNWPAILSIRWDLFDIVPKASNRTSFLPKSYQKQISVPWINLCDVKTVDQNNCAQSPVLAFTWLPALGKKNDPLVNEISLRLVAQLYENRPWKVVLVEFETIEKALQAKEHMIDIIHVLNSPAYQAYQHSNGGSRSPSEAAEAALMEMADGLLPASSRRRQKGSAIKRLTRIRRALATRKLTL